MEEEIEIFKIFKDTRKDGRSGALWEVSNLGNVRKNGKEILPYSDNNNYLLFGSHFKLHRAVAELFVPNPENKPTIDHINRDRQDNRASNLRWATMKEQAANRDNDAISKAISKSLIGNKRSLGHSPSEETRAKISAALLGRIPSEDTRAKMRVAALGYKHTLGKVWVINPTTAHSTMVNPSQLNEFLDKGYVRGRKLKK